MAFCTPATSVVPVASATRYTYSALPSLSTTKRSEPSLAFGKPAASASRPDAANFFLSAIDAPPPASLATANGINFSLIAFAGASESTASTRAPSRRGVANDVTVAPAASRPSARKLASMPAANASPNFFRAFGGSSSVKSSINSGLEITVLMRPPSHHLQRDGSASESPIVLGSQNNFALRRARDCGCDQCRPRVRSR